MILRKVVPARLEAVGDDEVLVRLSTGELARDGHVLVPQGAQLDNYRSNPVVLWQHDPEQPVAKASDIAADNDAVSARITFPPAGISPKADEIRGLVKAGVINAVSVGFDPLDSVPLDPKRPRGGQRITQWELLEASFVSVPADPGAAVIAREHERADGEEWRVGAARDLPIEDSDSWDGPAAEVSIFEHAGGDDFDPDKAKRGFLVYDAAKPRLKGSYKLPIAHAVGGQLKVPKGALRAAASRLPQTDIPSDVKDEAESVLAQYKKKAGIGDDAGDRAAAAARRRVKAWFAARDMNAVGRLAWLVDALAQEAAFAAFEAASEEDDSAVPGQLQDVLKSLGAVLVAMTEEELAELFAGDTTDTGAPMDLMTFKASPKLARHLVVRAGKAISAANQAKLEEADSQHEKALAHHADAVEAHAAIGERCDGMRAACGKADAAHEKLGAALDAGDLEAARGHHAALQRALDAIQDHNAGLGDEHEAMGDAHKGIKRCVNAARRCVRAVAANDEDDDDADSRLIQTSDGIGDSDGSDNDRKLRQADLAKINRLMTQPQPHAAA
jgi:HK97 family phage prohead protease